MKVNKDQILAFQLRTRPSAQGASYSIESLELAEDDSVGSWNGWMLTQTSVFMCFSIVRPRFELVLELVLGHEACGDATDRCMTQDLPRIRGYPYLVLQGTGLPTRKIGPPEYNSSLR